MATIKKTAILVLLVLLYISFGMAVFYKLERQHEESVIHERVSLENITSNFIESNSSFNKKELTQLLMDVLRKNSHGKLQWEDVALETWTYTRAAYFSITVITTIGYGNLAPKTWEGRIFCIFYAFFGIPLFMILLVAIGMQLNEKCQLAFNYLLKRCNTDLTWEVTIIEMTIIVMVFGLAIFLILPALIFSNVEGWIYSDALYYAFITISTIGFGDFVAGKSPPLDATALAWYRIGITFWIILGLAWLSTLISACRNIIQSLLEKGEEQIDHHITLLKHRHGNYSGRQTDVRKELQKQSVTSDNVNCTEDHHEESNAAFD